MTLVLISTITLWVGALLVLSHARWFSRPSLADRLRPYASGTPRERSTAAGILSVALFLAVIGPLLRAIGRSLVRELGVNEVIGVHAERARAVLRVNPFAVRHN